MLFAAFWSDIKLAFYLLGDYWWVYLPILLGLAFYYAWLDFKVAGYLNSLKWVLLQIKPPPEMDRSLKAVEQIFAGLHGIFIRSVIFKERFFEGKVPDWFSLEIVGENGATNFYVRALEGYKGLVTAGIFAQYPNVEISEVEDYLQKLPAAPLNDEYNLFGSELSLVKESAYPIQTYPFFEEKSLAPEDLKRIDPLAAVSEIFSTFQPGENFIVQILIRPVGDGWIKEAQKTLDKLLGKEAKKETNFLEGFFGKIDEFLTFQPAKKEEKKEKKLSAPEEEVVKAIGRKMSKLGFETGARIVYVAKKETFHRSHFSAMMGAFRQFAAPNLNSFKLNIPTLTYSKGYLSGLFPSDVGFGAKRLAAQKKVKTWRALKERAFPGQPPSKFFVLNTEELATIFHLPGTEVKAPLFPRVEAKKGQPPAGLAIE